MLSKQALLFAILRPKHDPLLLLFRTWNVNLPVDVFARLVANRARQILHRLISTVRLSAFNADPCAIAHLFLPNATGQPRDERLSKTEKGRAIALRCDGWLGILD